MRKIVVILLSLVMLISISACNKAAENMQISEPIKFTNKMTETELSRVEKHTLTLFDDPTEKEHKVSVVYSTVSLDELFAQLENNRDMISDEEYQIAFQEIEKMIEEGDYAYPIHTLIDGVWYNDIIPSEDYDGGELAFTVTQSNFTSDDTGNAQPEKVVCSNFEEYLLWAKQRYINDGFSESETDCFKLGKRSFPQL